MQEEGDRLSRRSAEAEATLKRLRGSTREADAERDRTAARMAALEAQLSQQAERHSAAVQDSQAQVRGRLPVCCVTNGRK